MDKPIIELKERQQYDIIVINFANGARINIQTTENGFLVNNSTIGEDIMYIKPSMGNAFEVLTGKLNTNGKA